MEKKDKNQEMMKQKNEQKNKQIGIENKTIYCL